MKAMENNTFEVCFQGFRGTKELVFLEPLKLPAMRTAFDSLSKTPCPGPTLGLGLLQPGVTAQASCRPLAGSVLMQALTAAVPLVATRNRKTSGCQTWPACLAARFHPKWLLEAPGASAGLGLDAVRFHSAHLLCWWITECLARWPQKWNCSLSP